MKKRIGWLRGRPIIEDLNSPNTYLKEITGLQVLGAKEGTYNIKYPTFEVGIDSKYTFSGGEDVIKPMLSVYLNSMIVVGKLEDYKYNSILKIDAIKALDDKTKDKIKDIIFSYGPNNFSNSIIRSIKGTLSNSFINIERTFTNHRVLEEVDVTIPKAKYVNYPFINDNNLKSIKLVLPEAEQVTGITFPDIKTYSYLKNIEIDAPKVTKTDFLFDGGYYGDLEKVKLNIPSIKYMNFTCSCNTDGIFRNYAGDGGHLKSIEIVGNSLPELVATYNGEENRNYCFSFNWWITSLHCDLPKCEFVKYFAVYDYCVRDFHCAIPLASKGLSNFIQFAYANTLDKVKNFMELKKEYLLKETNYKSVDEYMNGIFMHTFYIGAFGQADTFDSPLDLTTVFLHRDLTVQMFNELYDRKANGKTAECKILFNSVSFDELTQEDIKIATDKGFTILKN